jgi:hypothetical protein
VEAALADSEVSADPADPAEAQAATVMEEVVAAAVVVAQVVVCIRASATAATRPLSYPQT